MSKEFKGIIVSRLVVLISVILLPIVIFLIFIFVDFKLWFSDDPNLTFWIIKILCPLIFSISWIFFIILFATRFSIAIESMDKTVAVVPIRLKLFFGANALFILFIFVLPIITPIISVLIFASIAWRLTFRKEAWEDQKIPKYTKVLMVIFSILPIFCSIIILPQYLVLAVFLWEDIWIPILPYLFKVSYSIYTALAIGSLFFLIVNRGVSEYEQILAEPKSEATIWYIRIFELFLFIFFLFLEGFFTGFRRYEIVDLFYYVGFFIGIIVAIINFINGKRKNISFKSYFFGYLLAGVFMAANLFITADWSYWIQMLSLILSAAVFIFVFFFTFIRIEETEF
ncbi:MAG: hypothetical protein ACFFAH_02225 [Promethearchaeota archaeon]